MALEKVPHAMQIRFSFPPYPGAELRTIQVSLPEGALLLDAIRQARAEHHVPVYLEHSFLSTAQNLIQATRRATVDQGTKHVNQTIFSADHRAQTRADGGHTAANASNGEEIIDPAGLNAGTEAEQIGADENEEEEALRLQSSMIANYRTHTGQFYTQPEENLFPEAYHTLVHSPIPSLFDAILSLERGYAGEVDALLSAKDAEIHNIQTRHNNALASEAPQRNLTHLMTRHVERMEVSQATWNSQLDDLQKAQRSKYQEFVLELYDIYKRRQLQADHGAQTGDTSGALLRDGKDMVAEATRNVDARQLNTERAPPEQQPTASVEISGNDLPAIPQIPPVHPPLSGAEVPTAQLSQVQPAAIIEPASQLLAATETPPNPPSKEDPELDRMIKSILEMGFDVEQAKGALLISNRNMDHALNLLLEQPENIPRLVLAKQKVDAMKERARTRGQSSPQQPLPTLTGPQNQNTAQAPIQDPRVQSMGRPIERSASVSSPRPMIPGLNQGIGGSTAQKPWSPLPFFQQQKNALLNNNASPSVKKFGGWLNKAIENLGLDDEFEDSVSRNSGHSYTIPAIQPPAPASNLDESFTVVLGSSHSRVTHNLRLMVSDPAEVFSSSRVKTERDIAIHAQTASSLYGQNLTGLVQLVHIKDWAKYKFGRVCHQEFFQACQNSTELHFDGIERQLEAFETEFPLDGSTLREGDFILTRHSNLPMIHVVFHLFYGQSTLQYPSSSGDSSSSAMPAPPTHQPTMFSQSSDFVPKPDFLAGLRNIIKTAHRYEITMLSLPFLMMPAAFENQLVASMAVDPPSGSASSRHHRQGSNYGSSALSTVSTTSAAPSTSSSSSSSFMSASAMSAASATASHSNGSAVHYYITDQTYRDLQRRSEALLRHLKSFLMDSARQVKQVGNQGSEAEKFRASQGGDVKVVQFLLPRGTNDDMFRAFRLLLVNVFGGA
ncbi:hypothetical protein EDD11_003043 [Mortierella claussenii]|nr:hypothetical protein EDD11_003043 [Mortierella claussenii]